MAYTLLIADDSKTIRRVVEIAFARQGEYQLVSAGSGEEAIQKAREIRPALVLADHNMDGKDGYDVAEALIPEGMKVLLLTGSSKDFDEARASAAGVERLDKPFDCQSLLEKVADMVGAQPPEPAPGLRPVGSAPLAAAKPATPTPTPATPPPTAPVAPVAPRAPQTPGWQAGGGGALAGGDGNAAVDAAFGGAAAAATEAATAKVVEKAAPAVAAAAAASGNGAPTGAAITAEAREIIERVVWEVVPELAETLIREEIERLLKR